MFAVSLSGAGRWHLSARFIPRSLAALLVVAHTSVHVVTRQVRHRRGSLGDSAARVRLSSACWRVHTRPQVRVQKQAKDYIMLQP